MTLLTRRRRATTVLVIPLAQSNTMPARSARACAEPRRRIHRSSVARSSALTINSAMGRPVRISDLLHILDARATNFSYITQERLTKTNAVWKIVERFDTLRSLRHRPRIR